VVWLAAYNDFIRIMASGSPPLGLQLLVVNTVFLIIVILRRLRGRAGWNAGASHAMQISLLTLNVIVALQPDIGSLLQNARL
jgi:hypothetical protein